MNLFPASHLPLAACFLLLLSACGSKPSFTTYEDCILSNVKANQSREAVLVLRQACRAKFPEIPPSQAEIDAAAKAAADAHDAAREAANASADAAAQWAADEAAQAADAAPR